ncbi:MAG: Ig-like domain-containing protein, partial [Clostridia bacterium]|nr:Ig-like domain-containing protein [Clostridia bacterium]
GNYTIKGVLILPLTIANSNNLYPEINVHVSGASNAIESVQNVKQVIDYGVAFNDLNLPDTISVSLFNGEIHQLPVFWNGSKYEQFTIEQQVIEGIIQLDNDITNPQNLKAQVSLSIINRVIESVEELTRTYVRDDSVEFDLPEKVLVNLNDNTSNEYEVDWDYDTVNTTQLGEQTLLGKFVNLPINVTSQIVPECVITFTENPLNITNVGRVADIEVAYNVEFEALDLEETINVETFDGNVHTVNVIWNRGVYDQITPGDYLIRGNLKSNDVKNFDNLIITRIVRVSNETFYEYAWSYRIAIPNSISEMSGLASLINETINEKMIYGPYIEEDDDYNYNKRKIEIRYLGATLQDVT